MKFGIDFKRYYTRHAINGLVRAYCIETDEFYSYAFKNLYDRFYETYNIYLLGYGSNGIDAAEEMGLLDDLLVVAKEMFE